MPKSSLRGGRISPEVEVLALTPHALWLLIRNTEYMLDFKTFPWFANATISDVRDVELRFDHLSWPRLDVDLHIDSLAHPEQFPLVASAKIKPKPGGSSGRRALR